MRTPLPHHPLLYLWENLLVSPYYQMRIRQRAKKNQSRITMTINRRKRIAIARRGRRWMGWRSRMSCQSIAAVVVVVVVAARGVCGAERWRSPSSGSRKAIESSAPLATTRIPCCYARHDQVRVEYCMVVYGKGLSEVKVCQFVPSRYADGLVCFRRRHACSRTELEMLDSHRHDVLYCMYVCMYVI